MYFSIAGTTIHISHSVPNSEPSSFVQNLMKTLNMSTIPPHPTRNIMQQGRDIHVELNNLYLNDEQIQQIRATYKSSQHFCQLFSNSIDDQNEANKVLGVQGLDVNQLKEKHQKDLGGRWSRRWSTKDGGKENERERVLLRCQCGSSMEARKAKMPYDFTGCPAHIDVTYHHTSSHITRIVGILQHNEACEMQEMKRLPPIPLHPHVWKIAIEQINEGASIAAVQSPKDPGWELDRRLEIIIHSSVSDGYVVAASFITPTVQRDSIRTSSEEYRDSRVEIQTFFT
ncbi:hypothetical protein M422DRAFT_781831 [Sphaerobolus stellatus SS14]|uniref:Uncharacterized protein n=1 Tax=Sphaerobolus stellatus (strain SS14) TaxID=990650 RepID=A0A0C9VIA7_SPHS4|nr:hypothetical protein M422DRAFT_781831 [Sphaerobolus stellatus SS14]